MQFLRGDYSGKNNPIRPPWAVAENTFTALCEGCDACVLACPTRIIRKGRGRLPQIDFNHGECLFCGDCADVCRPRALNRAALRTPWSVTASIDPQACLAYRKVECRSCYDPCEAGAIRMKPRLGGVSVPVLDNANCTGCGACFAVCPSRAVNMNMNAKPVEVQT